MDLRGLNINKLKKYKDDFEIFYEIKWNNQNIFWIDRYPNYANLLTDRLKRRNSEISSHIKLGSKILDIGCGVGDILNVNAEKIEIGIGFDITSTNALICKKNLKIFKNIHIGISSAESIPIKDNSVDHVIMADVIEHVSDPLSSLKEINRILKPGGQLILTTPNKWIEDFWKLIDGVLLLPIRLPSKLFHILKNDHNKKTKLKDDPFYSSELKTMIEKSNFVIEKHYLIEFYPGSPGGGTFLYFLRIVSINETLRVQILEHIIEPICRKIFRLIEKIQIFNNRQILIAKKINRANK